MPFNHIKIFFFVFFVYSLLVETATKGLQEAFVFLRITKFRGDTFYRVLNDEDENPYLDIKEILEKYLDFSDVKCNLTNQYCQGTLQPANITYWIDGMENRTGNSTGTPSANIPDSSFVIKDGSLWLRYDAWNDWLPINVRWSLSLYYLSLIPEFKLLSELKEDRERSRKNAVLRRIEIENFDKIQPLYPTRQFDIEARYRIGIEQEPENKPVQKFNYDIVSDIYSGTLSLGGLSYYDRTGLNFSDPYRNYKIIDLNNIHLFELGNTYYEGSGLLLPYQFFKNGLRFDKLKRIEGAGKVPIHGYARPGAEADLYKNGLYQQTKTVGYNGQYIFEDVIVAGGDWITVKLYYPDGSEKIRVFRIASDSYMSIKKNAYDIRGVIGDTPNGTFVYSAFRYGLLTNFTTGLHVIKIPDYNKPALQGDIVIRPFYGLTVLSEAIFVNDVIDNGVRADITFLESNSFQLQYKFIDENSPLRDLHKVEHGKIWDMRHLSSFGKWQIQNEYEKKELMEKISTNIRKVFNRNINAFIEASIKDYNKITQKEQVVTGLNFNMGLFDQFKISRSWVKPESSIIASYRSYGGMKRNWDHSISFYKFDYEKKINFSGLVSWRISKNINIGLSAKNKYIGFNAFWTGFLPSTNNNKPNDSFASGKVSGVIRIPEKNGLEGRPLSGVKVICGGLSGITDNEGFYEIDGIPTNTRIKIEVDQSSLDVSMAAKDKYQVLYLRPATHISYSPEILWTAGIDGVVDIKENIPEDAEIMAFKIENGSLVAKGKIESDGFFVIEGLVPGEYLLEVSGLQTKIPPYSIKFSESEDWISGIYIQGKGNNFNHGNQKP